MRERAQRVASLGMQNPICHSVKGDLTDKSTSCDNDPYFVQCMCLPIRFSFVSPSLYFLVISIIMDVTSYVEIFEYGTPRAAGRTNVRDNLQKFFTARSMFPVETGGYNLPGLASV